MVRCSVEGSCSQAWSYGSSIVYGGVALPPGRATDTRRCDSSLRVWGLKHSRGVTPQHDAPTNHDPTHQHLIRVCWCEGTLPHDTTAGLRSLILREDRAGPGTRVNPSPSSIMRHHRVSERIPPPRGERPSNAQRIARANPIRDAHASPGTYRAPASPAPRRSCGEHVAWHTGAQP